MGTSRRFAGILEALGVGPSARGGGLWIMRPGMRPTVYDIADQVGEVQLQLSVAVHLHRVVGSAPLNVANG